MNDSEDNSWGKMMSEMVRYRQSFGHLDVPEKWSRSPGLRSWIEAQRRAVEDGSIREDRRVRLKHGGFFEPDRPVSHAKARSVPWTVQQVPKVNVRDADRSDGAKWEAGLEMLTEFKERFGHCDVPREWEENRFLGKWVAGQRREMVSGSMPKDRLSRLNTIGLMHLPKSEIEAREWFSRFEALAQYHRHFGNSDVPDSFSDLPGLAEWVCEQRVLLKAGKLSKLRAKMLSRLDVS